MSRGSLAAPKISSGSAWIRVMASSTCLAAPTTTALASDKLLGVASHPVDQLAQPSLQVGREYRSRPPDLRSAPSPTKFSTVTLFRLPELGRFIAWVNSRKARKVQAGEVRTRVFG